MATIQLGNTKVANKLISYAEKRAEVKEGVHCPPEYAKAQMKATRELWGKTNGVQAHHVIQSFKPGEVTPKQANAIGQDLTEKIAKGYEAVVYTHADKDHIHNHIVINSVGYEDGKKYQSSKKDLYKLREASDQLCLERGLSVILEPSAKERYTLAEKSLIEKGRTSWKDELRQVIDHERMHTGSFKDLKQTLTEKYDIEVKERGKFISFKHPDAKKFVRGKTLGLAYERGTLEHELSRKIEQVKGRTGQERGHAHLSDEYASGVKRIERVAETDSGIKRPHEKLPQHEHGQDRTGEDDLRQRDRQHQNDKQASHDRDAFDLDQTRAAIDQQRRANAKGLESFTKTDEPEQQANTRKNERNGKEQQPAVKQHERKDKQQYEQHAKQPERDRKRSKEREHGLSL